MAPTSSTQLGEIFLCNTLETVFAYCDFPSIIIHMKVFTNVWQTPPLMKLELYRKMSGSLIDKTCMTTTHALRSIKHWAERALYWPNPTSPTCPVAMETASSLVQWAHPLRKCYQDQQRRIIGWRCRCVGHALGPEKGFDANGRWRRVMLTLLALMNAVSAWQGDKTRGRWKECERANQCEVGVFC